jgi:hypothetical protein
MPNGDQAEGAAPLEDFVAAGAVRKVILGTSELPVVEVLAADDFDDCFAGRADFPLPKRAAKWRPRPKGKAKDQARAQIAADLGIRLAPDAEPEPEPAELEIADMSLETPVVHPAFEVMPPAARRAAPPQLRERAAADCEAAYGRSSSRRGEGWWVIGMGLAACAVLFSGTLVDFISREAMRRSHVEAVVLPKGLPAAATAKAGAAAIPNPAATATVQGAADERSLPLAATVNDNDKPE